jgi:NAD(P)-dependent dehydrogenase (short-subunit alcohol dehydrogenase family)
MAANVNTILILGPLQASVKRLLTTFIAKARPSWQQAVVSNARCPEIGAQKGLENLPNQRRECPGIRTQATETRPELPKPGQRLRRISKMELGVFSDPSSTSTNAMVSEIATNLIVPIAIARAIMSHLLSLKKPTAFITVTSVLAFIPLSLYPMYNSTKAGPRTLMWF